MLMAEVYKFFFQNKLPKVLPQMHEALQFSPDRKIGDWFLLEEHNFIIVYGFTHEPYIFQYFLIPRVFSLELIRQKLIVQNEHFISFRKASKEEEKKKIPWVVGPFIIKRKASLLVVESR